MNLPNNFKQMMRDMHLCEQTKGLNIFEHGLMVNEYYDDLINHMRNNTHLIHKWKFPEWIYTHKDKLLSKQLEYNTVKNYQIFHDCGKPYCKYIDDEGKQHFPDHANVSADLWFSLHGTKQESDLIRMDMDIHTIKAKDVEEFASRKEALTLLLTGLCEVHANASMFGGIDSTSFKIKWKQINKRGKAILSCN